MPACAGGHMPGRRASQTREQKPAVLTDYALMSEETPKPPPPIVKDWYFWGGVFGLLSAPQGTLPLIGSAPIWI
jgi:hypothetical protein